MNTKDSNILNTQQPSIPVLRIEIPERRGHMRLCPPALSAILSIGEERQVVSIGDISFTGAKIQNAPPGLRLGDTFHLATCLQDRNNLKIRCTVAYVQGNEAQSEVGVRFEDVEDEESQALLAYLRHLLDNEVDSTDQALAG